MKPAKTNTQPKMVTQNKMLHFSKWITIMYGGIPQLVIGSTLTRCSNIITPEWWYITYIYICTESKCSQSLAVVFRHTL